MKTKENIAIFISIFVVGFFFVFGQGLISIFTSDKFLAATTQQTQLSIVDRVVGTGDVAFTGTRVTVNYIGYFPDGKLFDSSISRGEPFQFVLGAGQVIKGWDQGILGMRVGGKRILTIPPDVGYGNNDYGPIPGGSTIIFEVELLKVEQ